MVFLYCNYIVSWIKNRTYLRVLLQLQSELFLKLLKQDWCVAFAKYIFVAVFNTTRFTELSKAILATLSNNLVGEKSAKIDQNNSKGKKYSFKEKK